MGRKIKSIDSTNNYISSQTTTAKPRFIQRKGHKAQTLKPSQPGATVYVTDMDCIGTVTRPLKKPRSYLVNTPSTVVKRNRVQLKNIPIETNKTEGCEKEKTCTLNISNRPKRIKTLSLKARENLGFE